MEEDSSSVASSSVKSLINKIEKTKSPNGATSGKSPGVKSLSAHFGGVFKKSRPRPEKTSDKKSDAPVEGNIDQPEKEPEKAPKSPKSSKKQREYSSDDSKGKKSERKERKKKSKKSSNSSTSSSIQEKPAPVQENAEQAPAPETSAITRTIDLTPQPKAINPAPEQKPVPPAIPARTASKPTPPVTVAVEAPVLPKPEESPMGDIIKRMNSITEVERVPSAGAPVVREATGLPEKPVKPGFANLPNQLYRKSVKDGFEFSLMVVGESGLGKSTLTNSLFLTDVYSDEYPGPSQRVKKTLEVQKTCLSITENGIKLNLTVVDTPGFGDNVNNDKCWEPIQSYIDQQYDNYLNQESRVNRPVHIHDTRVHVCLYFIAPSGHGLKPLDIEFMRRLHEKVNIVPLIAKADTMTPDECHDFKKEILREIQMHNINIYEFPDVSDEEENRLQKKLKQRVPFAVIGSNVVLQINDRRIRARQYPWGIAEVENEEHCDFKILRDMLIRTHMQDLIDVTSSVHYENFRAKKLAGVMPKNPSAKSPIEQMNEEKREHRLKMKKMEKEMETVFDTKVNEKRSKLKQSEQELMRKHEQQKKKYETDLAELEQRRREFERERDEWEERQKSLPTKQKQKKGLF